MDHGDSCERVSMKALLKMNIRMRLLICERHIVGDPQHAIQGRVMKDTESVVSVLTYQFDRVTPSILESWQPDSMALCYMTLGSEGLHTLTATVIFLVDVDWL